MAKVKYDVPDYSKGIEKAIYRAVNRIGYGLEKEAKENAPVDSGVYRNNIKFDGKDEVTAHAEYSSAIEYGVKPRKIVAKSAKALTFTVGGNRVFTKFVNIPGRKPNPVMRNAAKSMQKQVSTIFKEELGRV